MSEHKHLSLAVHLHVYYSHMWPLMKQYLSNIADYPYHLFVTLQQKDVNLIEQIRAFHADTTFITVDNRGYDIGPFIYVLNSLNLDEYDLIMKIHTKNNTDGEDILLNHRYVNRKYWFQLLMEAVLGSPQIFAANISAFQTNPRLGMIGSKYCTTNHYRDVKEVQESVVKIMNELGFSDVLPITFVAGTMFMVRSSVLKIIQHKFTMDDFTATDGKVKDGTLAHVLERVFGCLVVAQGYKIKSFSRNIKFEIEGLKIWLKNFIYRKKITKSNYLQIKIFKIPVYRRKIKNQ